jgi:hypothetical protein
LGLSHSLLSKLATVKAPIELNLNKPYADEVPPSILTAVKDAMSKLKKVEDLAKLNIASGGTTSLKEMTMKDVFQAASQPASQPASGPSGAAQHLPSTACHPVGCEDIQPLITNAKKADALLANILKTLERGVTM